MQSSLVGNNPDLIYIEQNPNIQQETSFTHPNANITHPPQIAHSIPQKQKRQYNRGRVVQSLANDKFERTGEGLTYWDLCNGRRYKLVSTDKQAQYLLYYAKDAGFLHPSLTMTIPQQYFATKDQAELAYINNKKITHPHPTRVVKAFEAANADDDPDIAAAVQYAKSQEDLKVTDAASTMSFLTSRAIPIGLHKIHTHLDLNPDFIHEAYHARLADIHPDPTNNQAKKLEWRIENYPVKYYIFPNGAVDIYIPCSRRPFPIDIYDPDTTTTNIICFAGQIRQFLCSANGLKDYSGRIVPKLQQWRLLRVDINFDLRCSVTKYEITSNVQMTKFGDVFRIYKRMIDGKTHIRFEQDKVFFKDDDKDGDDAAPPSINESIGQTIVVAAREAQKELRIGA